jgi:hypothetical protein
MRISSNRALAKALGVSETAVRKAERAGRIARAADGTWDVARVKAAWGANSDAAQQRPPRGLRPVPAAALGAVRETLRDHGEAVPAGPGSGPGQAMTFLQARTANEVLKAQERKLRLQRLKGELVDRARATARVFTLARQERDAWAQWPARVAADLAAALGLETHRLQTALEAAVKAQLADLAEPRPRLD